MPGHGELRAGAHAETAADRPRRRASCPSASRASPAPRRSARRSPSAATAASFSKKRLQTSVEMVKPGGTGTPALRHLRQAGALAAQRVLHALVAVGRAAAEEVDVLGQAQPPSLRDVRDAIEERHGRGQEAEPVRADLRVLRHHEHVVEEAVDRRAQAGQRAQPRLVARRWHPPARSPRACSPRFRVVLEERRGDRRRLLVAQDVLGALEGDRQVREVVARLGAHARGARASAGAPRADRRDASGSRAASTASTSSAGKPRAIST